MGVFGDLLEMVLFVLVTITILEACRKLYATTSRRAWMWPAFHLLADALFLECLINRHVDIWPGPVLAIAAVGGYVAYYTGQRNREDEKAYKEALRPDDLPR